MFIKQIIAIIILLASIAQGNDIDIGKKRLHDLLQRSLNSSNRIINFTNTDFNEYVMKYPRPYDVVIFFTASKYQFARDLFTEYQYLVQLYDMNAAINTESNPTFFTVIEHQKETADIFRLFQFQSVPNMVVSKPHMAVISEMERKLYFKEYSWEITHTDNHVTTHKMLQFVNKRTKKNVEFRHTQETIYRMVGIFTIVAISGVLAYILLRPVWNHWVFWFIGSVAIYLTCCSGIVFCNLHQVPWTSRDQSGQDHIFSGGNRDQTGLEGWVVSGLIVTISLMFVLIGTVGQKCSQKFSSVFSILALIVIYLGITYLEKVYSRKGWYGPSFVPPEGYLKGPFQVDQGNNI